MTCDKCGKVIRFNEFYYGYDRNHYIGAPVDNTDHDYLIFALCKKCDKLLWEFVTGEKKQWT